MPISPDLKARDRTLQLAIALILCVFCRASQNSKPTIYRSRGCMLRDALCRLLCCCCATSHLEHLAALLRAPSHNPTYKRIMADNMIYDE